MTGFLAAALFLAGLSPGSLPCRSPSPAALPMVYDLVHAFGWTGRGFRWPDEMPRRLPPSRGSVPAAPPFRIVIDPGHGGSDDGAVGGGGLREKDLVLDVAIRLAGLLRRARAQVELTRADDTFLTLRGRVRIAEEDGADLFVSIHANAAPSHRSSGIETWFPGGRASRALAHSVQASLSTLPVENRGVKRAPFVVLAHASMPAVLAEIGFLSNRAEEARLSSPAYRQNIAAALFDGLATYIDFEDLDFRQ